MSSLGPCSYLLNIIITFRAKPGRVLRRADYLRFVASGVVGVIATTTALVILANFIAALIAKLLSILVTYIWTAEGWLYVSAVIDLFSRRVVG